MIETGTIDTENNSLNICKSCTFDSQETNFIHLGNIFPRNVMNFRFIQLLMCQVNEPRVCNVNVFTLCKFFSRWNRKFRWLHKIYPPCKISHVNKFHFTATAILYNFSLLYHVAEIRFFFLFFFFYSLYIRIINF